MSKWIEGKVVGKKRWTERLFSLQVAASSLTFVAGQFARLALPAAPGSKEAMLGRPYSFVNPPDGAAHEFYFNVLPEGPLSPRLAALEGDDSVWLLDRANGFFCVAELPDAATLWCLATGTGLGPYLSILRTEEPWEKFERVVLVHAVRHAADQASPRRVRAALRSLRSSAGNRTRVHCRDASPTPFATAGSRRGRVCR